MSTPPTDAAEQAAGTGKEAEAERQQLIVLSGLVGGWTEVIQLLSRARETFKADEAALLLVDATSTTLVPVASAGLDSPRHTGFRVPVGAGFAGRVAATGQPVILTDVNPETVLNPALHRRGIQSLLGVPVFGGTDLLGVLHVGSVTQRQFTDAEMVRLEQIAEQVSVEVLRRRASEEHIAALALQRSLLPSAAPRIAGLDIAARYLPADGDLGGDWYDVFQLPDERIGIVMGDVAGHGLAAAVVMGRLRSVLRAYALEHPDPADVLRLLDMKISYFEAGAFATVLYAVAEPPYDRFVVSSAGHLPPYLIHADGTAEPTAVAPDRLLGFRAQTAGSWPRHTTTVDVPPGASLFMFTDGLVERRPTVRNGGGNALRHGLERLRATLRPGAADEICTNVLAELIGESITEDDIAVLAVQRT